MALSPQDDASDLLMPPARPQPHHLAAARGRADADGRALLQQLCDLTARVLRQGLGLLGIATPEKM